MKYFINMQIPPFICTRRFRWLMVPERSVFQNRFNRCMLHRHFNVSYVLSTQTHMLGITNKSNPKTHATSKARMFLYGGQHNALHVFMLMCRHGARKWFIAFFSDALLSARWFCQFAKYIVKMFKTPNNRSPYILWPVSNACAKYIGSSGMHWFVSRIGIGCLMRGYMLN